jgi:hypothetical protein
MRFWKRSSYVAPLFQANDDNILDDHIDNLTNSRHVPSRSSSLCSSCSASICLASDPMHEEKSETNPSAARNQSVCGIAVDDLYIGDIISNEERGKSGMDSATVLLRNSTVLWEDVQAARREGRIRRIGPQQTRVLTRTSVTVNRDAMVFVLVTCFEIGRTLLIVWGI